MDELQKRLEQLQKAHNQKGRPEFEGYSPEEMHYILYQPFNEASPLQLAKLPDEDYRKIPLWNQIKYLMEMIDRAGEMKLTSKGYLPVKAVKELYNQKFMTDIMIEEGISKLYKEIDANSIHLARILVQLSGLAKKRKNRLSLTRKGQEALANPHSLFKHIFETFTHKFNWGYFDNYAETPIGQIGYGFSLILIHKYGDKKRHESFYAEKYFRAFPQLMEDMEPIPYISKKKNAINCYSLRTFERFLDYFGVIDLEKIQPIIGPVYLKKTPLFDRLFQVRPPANP